MAHPMQHYGDREPKQEEFPAYDSCKPCQTLTRIQTTIGPGYGCNVCQMTYIQVDKGAYIPFEQAMTLYMKKKKQEQERAHRAQQAQLRAKPRKNKKRRRR